MRIYFLQLMLFRDFKWLLSNNCVCMYICPSCGKYRVLYPRVCARERVSSYLKNKERDLWQSKRKRITSTSSSWSTCLAPCLQSFSRVSKCCTLIRICIYWVVIGLSSRDRGTSCLISAYQNSLLFTKATCCLVIAPISLSTRKGWLAFLLAQPSQLLIE